jgi:hypothetical protein
MQLLGRNILLQARFAYWGKLHILRLYARPTTVNLPQTPPIPCLSVSDHWPSSCCVTHSPTDVDRCAAVVAFLVDTADSRCNLITNYLVPPTRQRVHKSRPDAVLLTPCRAVNLARLSQTYACFRDEKRASRVCPHESHSIHICFRENA